MTKACPPTNDQWKAATKILLALLRVQTEAPGAISPDDLPKVLHDAADERNQQGDQGAARLLNRWAVLVTQPKEEWD
jgi:hypothetical protein